MKKIAVIVDNPFRDLPGLVLLTMRLCSYGHTCYLVPHNLVYSTRELWYLAPDFVLLNYLRLNNQEAVRQLLGAGIQVGMLDTEGGVLIDLDEYNKWQASDPVVRHGLACVCSWGSRFASHAVEKGWYKKEQVAVTGSPRFDFYAEPWKKVSIWNSSYADVYRQPLVLVNGNFTLANPQFQTPEKEMAMYVKRFKYDQEYVRRWQEIERETMVEMARLANRVSAAFPRVNFVFRPHPFERQEAYESLLERRSNLHLIKAGTVDGWLLRARALIQRNCSTTIEAGFIGVPSLSPAWIKSAVKMPTVDSVSVMCRTEEELKDELGSALSEGYVFPEKIGQAVDRVVDEWFHKVDGRAYERVADRVHSHLGGFVDRASIRKRCRSQVYKRGSNSLRSILGGKLRSFLDLPPTWCFRKWKPIGQDLSNWDRSEKRFGVAEARKLADLIERCSAGRLGPVGVGSCQERGDYLFGFTSGRSVAVFPLEAKDKRLRSDS